MGCSTRNQSTEIEGMAYEEIAEMTGVSLGTVKSRIARARAVRSKILLCRKALVPILPPLRLVA